MGSAERRLAERDPPDNPAVGFRQTSPPYRVESDPFMNEYRARGGDDDFDFDDDNDQGSEKRDGACKSEGWMRVGDVAANRRTKGER